MDGRVILTMAGLTLRESSRRKVLWALAALTVTLLALSAWGFAKLHGVEAQAGSLTSGEAKLVASQVLNLVMFGMSLIAALGTAFLAGPTLSGELESGVALSMLARPVTRASVLLGKWLGLICFGAGFIAVAGLAQFLVVRLTVGYWPPQPLLGLALLAAQTAVLLTLGLLLSTLVSPMASGIVAVGIFGATWIAGVVGGVGAALHNTGVADVANVSRILIPTDGLWRGAMHAFQDPSALGQFGDALEAFPFLSSSGLTAGYLLWVLVWLGVILALAQLSFARKDI